MGNVSLGKYIVLTGMILVGVGLLVMFSHQIPWLGRLPGDIHIKRDHFQFYFPITTSLLLSVLLSLLLYLFRK
ncbi:MAG: DUF2905 domain-containing protein [Elusimicrobia bacterium]|nr:DUF2905 domain-containing protein [Candidatus Obscuribacterium magneticum]